MGAGSRSTLDAGPERAVLREVRIVVEPDDLEAVEQEARLLEGLALVGLALAPEGEEADRIHAVDTQGRFVERAQVDGIAEAEAVGMEQALGAVGPDAVAEDVEQGLLDVGRKIAGLDAGVQLDLERDVARVVRLQVISRHPEALEVLA